MFLKNLSTRQTKFIRLIWTSIQTIYYFK